MPITPYDDEHLSEGYKALREGDHVGALYHLANIRYVPATGSRAPEIQGRIEQTDWLKFETDWLREEILKLKEYEEMQTMLQQIASDTTLSDSDRAFFLAGYEYSYLEKIREYLTKQLTETNVKEKYMRAAYLVSRKEAIAHQLQQIQTRQTEIVESLKQHA